MTEIIVKPFDWNDNLSEIAQEDFSMILLEIAQSFMEWLQDMAKKTGFSENEIQGVIKQFLMS